MKEIVQLEKSNKRLDKALSDLLPDISRSEISQLIKDGKVVSHLGVMKPSFKVVEDLEIEIDFSSLIDKDNLLENPQAEDLPLNIIYEDKEIIVIDKDAGITVHPGVGNESGTLVNALLYHCGDNLAMANEKARAGIVHRLDKDTSGILVVAKTDEALIDLQKQFKNREVTKIYEAIVHGTFKDNKGFINAPIARNPKKRQEMSVQENGKVAKTEFEIIGESNNTSYLRINLLTGRTHQIRVHMKYINHPILGDPIYGFRQDKLANELCLHAKSIKFRHPLSNEEMYFETELPAGFSSVLQKLNYNLHC